MSQFDRIKRVLLGRELGNDRLTTEKLSRIWGLPIMASDALSSVAYAVEEILMATWCDTGTSPPCWCPTCTTGPADGRQRTEETLTAGLE